MSQTLTSNCRKTTQISTKIDTPGGVIPAHAASNPQPPATAATTAVPKTSLWEFRRIIHRRVTREENFLMSEVHVVVAGNVIHNPVHHP